MYRAVIWWLLIQSMWRVVCVVVVQHTERCALRSVTRLFLRAILAIALHLLYYHIRIIICFSRTVYSLHRQIKFQDIRQFLKWRRNESSAWLSLSVTVLQVSHVSTSQVIKRCFALGKRTHTQCLELFMEIKLCLDHKSVWLKKFGAGN